ncbi:MAG: hypothetical protein EXX96DRAFT_559946 [Benjaminiella poitrasii]|nr:MAG: hypothetical protein EXX96DRAFT_559946 [Benjaminiella poitrasii]
MLVNEHEATKRPYLLTRSMSINSITTTQATLLNVHASNDNNLEQEQQTRKLSITDSCTEQELMLQRQSSLADDTNCLDHPDNIRRLTKEIDRVNREYKSLKQFQDPLSLSLQRVKVHLTRRHIPIHSPVSLSSSPSTASSSAISTASSSYSSTSNFFLSSSAAVTSHHHQQQLLLLQQQRRASSEYLLNKEERRNSIPSYLFSDKPSTSSGFMSRFFFGSSSNNVQQQYHVISHKRHPYYVGHV